MTAHLLYRLLYCLRQDLNAGFEDEGMLEETSSSVTLKTESRCIKFNSIGAEADNTCPSITESRMFFHYDTERLMLIQESCDTSRGFY
jgi:hypothetical protein